MLYLLSVLVVLGSNDIRYPVDVDDADAADDDDDDDDEALSSTIV